MSDHRSRRVCAVRSGGSIAFLLALALGWVVGLAGCAERVAPPEPAPGSPREIAQGPIVGSVGAYGSHVWRGLPYAAPPVGPLRWRAPAPPEGWSTTREALESGAFCPQFASRFGGVPGEEGEVLGDEDCLTLDVYAAQRAPDEVPRGDDRVPVLFWIHGGGNVIGHKGFYDGGNLAQTHDVVVVAINYRIGPLGWFRHAALREGATSDEDRSGNYGTLDMIRALEWVQQNIGAFGGDPGNVTIFGESAGARDVFSLLVSPRARGLFHRAIAQSGGTYLSESLEAEAEAFVEDGGAPGSSSEALVALVRADEPGATRSAARARVESMSNAEIEAFLRSRTPAQLLSIYATEESEGLIDLPQLFRDGVVLPDEPAIDRFADPAKWNVVPVMVGTNRDENKLFMYASPRWVTQRLGFLPRLRDRDAFEVEARYRALMWKASGSDEPATAMRTSSDAVYSYRFDWDEEPTILGADLAVMLGASHGFEIPFVFGHFDLGEAGNIVFTDDNLPGREELAGTMMSYWVRFATAGDPGRGVDGSLPEWSAWSLEPRGDKFMILETTAGGGLRMSAESVTSEAVVAAATRDPFLAEREDRCEILTRIVGWSDQPVPPECEEIGSLAAGGSEAGD